MTKKITATLVSSLPAPTRGNAITYDTDQKGLGVRVTATGVKAFVFNYTVAGRERRYTIGRVPEWTVLRARERAKELRRLIDQGGDPVQQRQDNRDAPTIKDLWERYRDEHLPHLSPRAQKDITSMWEKLILPGLAPVKVAHLTSTDSDRLHRQISASTPIRANRVLEVFRKALNLAVRWKWIDRNPVDGFRRNPERPRERILTAQEWVRFEAALATIKNTSTVAAFHLLCLTGARLREVLNAEWSQFDLTNRRWKKPAATTKQRRDHITPLSDASPAREPGNSARE